MSAFGGLDIFQQLIQGSNPQPQAQGMSMGQMFGSPENMQMQMQPPPGPIDKLKQLSSQFNMSVGSQPANSVSAKMGFMQQLQQKYGPDFMKNPEAQKLFQAQGQFQPLQGRDLQGMSSQAERTLGALKASGG